MALKAILDSLDGVSDDVKAHYEEGDDGKFRLSVEPAGGFSLENVDGLKSALGKERTEREKLERQQAKFKDLDPDKAREALEKWEEFRHIDPAKEADKIVQTKLDAAKAQLLEKHQAEIGARDERIGKMQRSIEEMLVDRVATEAIAQAKGKLRPLLPHVRNQVRVKEQDGQYSVEVVDEHGNARIADAKGTPMDIAGLVSEMRESDDFAPLFEGTGATGTDAKPANGAGQPGGAILRGDWGGDRAERAAAIAQRFKLPAS